ncbi:attractin-like protein 1 [Diadema antillarum]|uniref:attractin-like protein 1 n=1 Tax=Diadema antillarum TaxID=105358 RepID=UPI003A84BDA6
MTDSQVFSFLYAKSKFRMGNCLWRIPHLNVCVVVLCALLTLLHIPQYVMACQTDADCGADGTCDAGECVCSPGWRGDQCEHCHGRTRLQDSSGYIIEAIEDYQVKTKCTWLIDGGRPGVTIRFIPVDFGTECSWDYLYIYDGDSIYSPLVASLNGPIRHGLVDIKQEIVTTSGFAFLYFYSDAAFKLDGFNISYSIDTCPGDGCSGRGICDSFHLNCSCDPLWLGEACDIPACPSNCSGRGYCDADSESCVCHPGFKGRDCGTREADSLWEIRSGVINQGRASASTVLVDDDLWVIGGYAFDDDENVTISKFNIPLGTSEKIEGSSDTGEFPRSRYSHTTVHYQDDFLMFGGSLHGRSLSDELWSFNHSSRTWSKLTNGFYSLEGHSAHVVDDVMIVIFGYSPVYGYLNSVQEYNITSGIWSLVSARGSPVKGAYGHSSVYDPVSQKIYIHGGYKLRTTEHMLSDDTYSYNIVTKSWVILQHSEEPRFLHSAVILNGLMLIFGGNTHTDASQSTGAKCYSSDFLAYNIECGSWEFMDLSSGLYNEVSRFGHSSFVYQGSMWIYSGYNGLLTTSALHYIPGNCSVITNSSECMEGLPGLWCGWDMARNSCVLANSVPGLASNKSICPKDDSQRCNPITSCKMCVETPGCGWCNGNCSSQCTDEVSSRECSEVQCSVHTSCRVCNSKEGCQWKSNVGCQTSSSSDDAVSCDDPCENYSDCASCLPKSNSQCMWCASQQRCIESNSYMTSFPYGLCLEWRTSVEGCPSSCADHLTCGDCEADPACGWCDSGMRTGLGTCMEGSYTGPINVEGPEPVLDYNLCPASNWYFVQCPSCQCNGHSQCPQNSSECGLCEDFTQGDSCETCQLGYYGRPQNGGVCYPCSCNGHSDVCEQTSGECYCNAKGVKGHTCDRCDSSSKYYGNPKDGGYCYYQLLMNWQYTFNLSENEDKNYTNIAMMTSPNSPKRDIEFQLRVSNPCYLNITYTANDSDGEQTVVDGRRVNSFFKMRFSRYDFDFTEEGNTTFYIYLSNFTTPFSFQCVLTQAFLVFTLLQFLIVFFSCFLFFLLFFVLGWKFKQRCDAFRHRQQRAVELAVMASRPFASIDVEISKSAPPDLVAECRSNQVLTTLEPCSDNKAGIMTVLMQLPLAEGDAAPPYGQPRLTLASALIQLKPKKSELREQRDREREQREREREQRSREREQREREQGPEGQGAPPLRTAPLAQLPPDDPLTVSTVPVLSGGEDPRHIRHYAEYDNPAMV